MIRLFALAALAATPAVAQIDTLRLASDLGTVIGSEALCGLSYDQAAIAAYIDANAPADDMGFAGTMTMMAQAAEMNNANLSPSARTAHCAAVAKSARHYGFID